MLAAKKLIEDETVLLVNKILAKAFGLNNAIVFRQILYWIDIKRKAKSKEHFHDQCWWTYNSYTDWKQENFDFWSRDTIIRIITRLEELGLVRSGNYNQREKDLTKWYTINYKAYYAFMKLWSDHAYPVAGDGKPSLAYKVFLEDWEQQREEYNSLSSCPDPLCKLHIPPMQVATDVTKDYPEITKKKKLSATQKRVAGSQKPKPEPRHKEPDAMFDAVQLHVFGSDSSTAQGGRVGQISSWLKQTNKSKRAMEIGEISSPAQPKHVKLFAEWWAETKKVSMPRDLTKFVDGWREWATEVRASANGNGASPKYVPLEESMRRAQEEDANA